MKQQRDKVTKTKCQYRHGIKDVLLGLYRKLIWMVSKTPLLENPHVLYSSKAPPGDVIASQIAKLYILMNYITNTNFKTYTNYNIYTNYKLN
jgi:hypothetical protein